MHGNLYIYFFTFYIQKGEEDIYEKIKEGSLRMAASKSKNTGHSGRNTKKKTAMEQEVGRFIERRI